MWGHRHEHRCGPRGYGGRGMGGFGGGWGMRGGWGPDGGGRRRQFDGSELRLLLLALIAEEPRHGYELIREIEERTGGGYAPSPGVVYPTLTLLDEMGLIEEIKEEGARKRFAITETGRAHLAEQKPAADALIERLATIGEREKGVEPAPIRRSVMGLMMAVREAVASGRDNPDIAHEIAAILDEAARKIERLEK